jgi:topoisomerase-4 subunit A
VTREDIDRLLEIRIKRISRYDIDKKRKEVKAVREAIKVVERDLKDMIGFTSRYLDDLLTRYGHLYPRRTELTAFDEVQARQVALSNLTMAYDREAGFLGHAVKGAPEQSFACSEYDKLLLIFKNGSYKVINVPDKVFVGHDLLWVGKVEEKTLFNVVYREGGQGVCYVKRFHTPKFILEKEYRLFPEHKRSEILFLKTGEGLRLRVHYAPNKRARSNKEDVLFDEFLVKGASAIGKRLALRPLRKIEEIAGSAVPSTEPEVQPTLFSQSAVSSQASAKSSKGKPTEES